MSKSGILTSVEVKNVEAQASALAAKLASSADLNNEFANAIQVAEDNKLTTFSIHLTLKDLFSADELAALPLFDSKEWERPEGSNTPFDKFKYKDPGTGAEKTGSFYRLTAAKHPIGVAHFNVLKKMADSRATGVNNEYSAMTDHDLRAAKRTENERYETFFTKFRLALSTFPKMVEGNTLGTVIVDYVKVPKLDENGRIVFKDDGKTPVMVFTKDSQCIMVQDKFVPTNARRFTIPNFLRLDVETAKLNGGTYEQYITSNKRSGNEGGEGDGIKIEKAETFESMTAAQVHWLMTIKADTSKTGGLIKYYSGAGSDDRLWTLAQLEDLISIVTQVPAIRKRIDQMLIDGGPVKQKVAA